MNDAMSNADDCGHGLSYDEPCTTCDAEIAEAKAAGAATPREVGLYFKGKQAAEAEAPQVEIQHHTDQPNTCLVWQHGVLMFTGRSYAADLTQKGATDG